MIESDVVNKEDTHVFMGVFLSDNNKQTPKKTYHFRFYFGLMWIISEETRILAQSLQNAYGLITLAVSRTRTGTGTETWTNGLYCFMQNLSHYTWRGMGPTLLSPIVLAPVAVPVPVLDTASVITPLVLRSLIWVKTLAPIR